MRIDLFHFSQSFIHSFKSIESFDSSNVSHRFHIFENRTNQYGHFFSWIIVRAFDHRFQQNGSFSLSFHQPVSHTPDSSENVIREVIAHFRLEYLQSMSLIGACRLRIPIILVYRLFVWQKFAYPKKSISMQMWSNFHRNWHFAAFESNEIKSISYLPAIFFFIHIELLTILVVTGL